MPDTQPQRQPAVLSKSPPVSVIRYGEERPLVPPLDLKIGALAARLEGSLLRSIRFDGHEIIRGIQFLARDENWGTLPFETRREHHAEHFYRLDGEFPFSSGPLPWRVEISLQPDGLMMSGVATPTTRALTNRTGFVLLHPPTCAGLPMEIEHPDSSKEEASFPTLIKPDQPAFNIRALRYAPTPDLWLHLQFAGDVFEMEDQRNWLDASFKTYCRPQSMPKPYAIEPGQEIRQSITVRVERKRTQIVAPEMPRPEVSRMPAVGLGVPLDSPLPGEHHVRTLAAVAPAFLLIEADLAKPRDFGPWVQLANAIGARVAIDAWSSNGRVTEENSRALVQSLVAVQAEPQWLTLDARDPQALERMQAAFNTSSLPTQIGIGTREFFTELNNHRPGPEGDFVRWTMNPTVHALDDTTIMESAQTLPWLLRSAQTIAGERTLAVGPQTLRPRSGPVDYTAAAAHASFDPRQRGLLCAAWTVGHLAGLLSESVDRVAFFEPIGPRGLLYLPAGFEQPWFDQLHATTDVDKAIAHPVCAVLSLLCAQRGQMSKSIGIPTADSPVAGIEFARHALPGNDLSGSEPSGQEASGKTSHWLIANCSENTVIHTLPAGRVSLLDETSFADACAQPIGFWDRHAKAHSGTVELPPYAVARAW